MKRNLLALVSCWAVLLAARSPAINFGPFGAHGEGGSKNGQTFRVGPGVTMFELDGFLSVGSEDLNGSLPGNAALLSRDAVPAGLVYGFTTNLSADGTDLLLTYSFSNTTSGVLTNLRFSVLCDAEIDELTNTFFNEYGIVNGMAGVHGYDADQWQIDEPGFQTGTLLRNLYQGTLNNSNSIPQNALNDVAMGLSFASGTIDPGSAFVIQVLISEQAHALSSFSLVQRDADPASAGTTVTLSGVVVAGAQIDNPGPQPTVLLTGQIVRDGATNGPACPTTVALPGVKVLLLSNSVPVQQVTTDNSGRYTFTVPPAIPPGAYVVQVDENTTSGFTFVPAGVAPLANCGSVNNFATNNPSSVVLPAAVPVLNFAFRGASAQVFGNQTGLLLFSFQSWTLNRGTGSLLATIALTNPPSSTASFGPPYQLGLTNSANFYYPHPAGTLPDGESYIDLSAAVNAQIPGGVLAPGQGVMLTNAVEVYSLIRSPAPSTLFEIWATQQ